MLQEFAKWFSKKTPTAQKKILLKLEEVFHIQNHFGLVEDLRNRIKYLESDPYITSLKDQIKKKDLEIGKLKSYIQELEHTIKKKDSSKPLYTSNLDLVYKSIPKSERDFIRQQVVCGVLYKRICELNKQLTQKNKEYKHLNSTLLISNNQLLIENQQLKQKL